MTLAEKMVGTMLKKQGDKSERQQNATIIASILMSVAVDDDDKRLEAVSKDLCGVFSKELVLDGLNIMEIYHKSGDVSVFEASDIYFEGLKNDIK